MNNNPSQDDPLSADQVADILTARNLGQDRLYKREDGKLHVNHAAAANAMCMYIANIPMPDHCKTVLMMKIGNPLLNKRALSNREIALQFGWFKHEVVEVEEEGKRIIQYYLEHVTGTMNNGPVQKKSIVTDILNKLNP